MKKYYRKYLILAIIGSVIIGLAFYLLLNNYLDKKIIVVASRNISVGERINEEDLCFKEYYKNSLPENYLTKKEDAIGNIINTGRRKDDYISGDMFDEGIQRSIFDNLSPGDVVITVNVQDMEPILGELGIGNYVSIVSTVKDEDLTFSEYFKPSNINSTEYSDQNNYDGYGNNVTNKNKYFSTGNYIDNATFNLSENIISVNGQIIVRNLEIICMEENARSGSKNIILNNDNNVTSVYLKCGIKEASIVAKLTKDDDYRIIVEDI